MRASHSRAHLNNQRKALLPDAGSEMPHVDCTAKHACVCKRTQRLTSITYAARLGTWAERDEACLKVRSLLPLDE